MRRVNTMYKHISICVNKDTNNKYTEMNSCLIYTKIVVRDCMETFFISQNSVN